MDKVTNNSIAKLAQLHQSGEHEKAFLGYQALLSQQPNSPELHHIIGIYFAQSGQTEKAHQHFKNAIDLDPDNFRYQEALATLHSSAGQPKKAIALLEKIVRNHPDYHTAKLNLASCLIKIQAHDKAQTILSELLTKNLSIANIHYHQALIDMHNQNVSNAIAQLELTLKLEPNHLPAMKQLAKAYHQNEQHQAAKLLYESGTAADPNDFEFKHLGAANLLALDEHEPALIWLLEVYAQSPDLEDLNHNLGAVYLTQGQFKSALHHWLREHHQKPTTETFYNVGMTYQYLNRLEDARTYLQETLKRDPKHLGAMVNLGANALQCFDHPLAISYYQSALTIKPNDKSILHVLNALQGNETDQKAPAEYVENLFDQYANHYDDHLEKVLHYQVPELITRLINEYGPKAPGKILDAGCGTGLMAKKLQPFATRLVGIDLSNKMLEKAAKTKAYDRLEHTEITSMRDETFDIIILADVMPYIGNPEPILKWASEILNPGGLICLSFEIGNSEKTWQLSTTARYQHHPEKLQEIAINLGFQVKEMLACNLRKQLGEPLKGGILALTN